MGTGPEREYRVSAYCSGQDCLRTRRMHIDPVDPMIVLCDYCGRAFLKRQVIEDSPQITLDRLQARDYTSP